MLVHLACFFDLSDETYQPATKMASLNAFLLLFLVLLVDLGYCLNRYIDSYDTLNYRPVLDRRKRSIYEEDYGGSPIELRFRSHNRTFHLKLHPINRYDDVFSKDHFLDVDGSYLPDNQLRPHRFLFDGYLIDDPASRVYGSVIDGIFDGHIISGQGDYYTVEKAARYFDSDDRPMNFHSVIYRDDQINHVKFRAKRSVDEPNPINGEEKEFTPTCGLDKQISKEMQKVQNSVDEWPDECAHQNHDGVSKYMDEFDDLTFPHRYLNRSRRDLRFKNGVKQVNGRNLHGVRTCTIYLQADHKLYEAVYNKEGNRNHIRTREEIVGLFYNHIKAVNQIYESTDFGGVQGLNFVIQRTSIYTKDTCLHGKPAPGSDNPFCEENVDVSNYLNLNSQRNHSAFCLAYALTFRDFIGGTLGLAWVASPTFSTAGGICQVYQKYNEGQQGTAYRSLNTGIITLVNYGNRVPLRVSQLTMAHEIGHNFGAPHDQTAECQPGLPDGNYIMFASATSGDKVNNAKFSPCSVSSISQVLYEVLQQTPVDAQLSVLPMFGKKRNCFQERTSAFCGNQIREPGEQCDCGFSQQDCEEMGDRCCQPRENHQSPCKRTLNARCSPSEGLCCKASQCDFYTKAEGQLCREESECLFEQHCNGKGAACPDSAPKPDGLPCQDVTKVCHSGSCNGSICALVGLKDSCYSSFDLPEFAAGKFHQTNRQNLSGLLLHPGSPCNNYKGYCDILRKCRSVDSNGPLARLKNLFFNKHTYKSVSQWVQEHWWACVFIGIGVLLFMALFVKCCAVHTPSTNPNKLPAQHLTDTLRHPAHSHPSNNHSGGGGRRHRQNGVAAGASRSANHAQQRQSQCTSAAAGSHHGVANRVPPNMSAPPLIPPPPAGANSQPALVNVSNIPAQTNVSPPHSVIPEPPPPYTPTDPAASNSTATTSVPSARVTSPILTGALTGVSPMPTPLSLPGAPLPPPLIPGPPLPGQGPKPGRRRPKPQDNKTGQVTAANNSKPGQTGGQTNKTGKRSTK
ncbi:metallo-peptidase family m12B reprolysin-like domain-containing protein [Ditylenchus destructor]|uniref:ADAM10 endopeptidase n=1 Tax=Ditylenchus destructor TaxID=166010 RepID=A0AAD4NGM5_9BILA|nr:metallo-peptidase family m12B reprolysin-like domain-containing protein [Ditylenchus destructor]